MPGSSSEPALDVQCLSLVFGEKPILREVSFQVRPGESVAVIGPNGAGKSTLLRCLDRIERRFTGQVRIGGRPANDFRQKELAAVMGYVPQQAAQMFPFTVFEFVLMGRYPHMTPFSPVTSADRKAVAEMLELTETAELAERTLPTLSGGERQQVHIAAALAQEPQILLLDEPTTFLDYKHQEQIGRLLHHVNRNRAMTLISVSHDINQASLLADRIVALKAGRLVFDGTTEALMDNEILEQIYDKSFQFVPHPVSGRTMILPQEMEA